MPISRSTHFFEGKALEVRLEFRVEVGDFWIGQFLVYL